MVEPLRHRQTKEAATDMFSLQPPRHISTLTIRDRSLRAENRSMSAVPRKRQTCATQQAAIRFGSGGCPRCLHGNRRTHAFPGAPGGIRSCPNVPPHRQRDKGQHIGSQVLVERSMVPQPWMGKGNGCPPFARDRAASGISRRKSMPLVSDALAVGAYPTPRSCHRTAT